MKIIGIIPARMGSSRLPGKPLADISGIPMIGHVYHRCKMASVLDELYIATCDDEIVDYVKSIGGNVVLTSPKHERASDRTEEALLKIEDINNIKSDIVVMIQGDEPLVTPDMIDSAVQPLLTESDILVTNLMSEIINQNDWYDPNEIKVVVDKDSNALYFSREPIPSDKKYNGGIKAYKQICIIPFRRDCLINFSKLEPTMLEIVESIDMNRFLENGIKVKMILSENTISVDTIDDLNRVELLMKKDKLYKKYI